jgi:hypothetical protein
VVWEERTGYQVLVWKSEGKIHLEELIVDEDQIKMDLHEKGWENVDAFICHRKGRNGWLL